MYLSEKRFFENAYLFLMLKKILNNFYIIGFLNKSHFLFVFI